LEGGEYITLHRRIVRRVIQRDTQVNADAQVAGRSDRARAPAAPGK